MDHYYFSRKAILSSLSSETIAAIKKEGEQKAIKEAISSKLWGIKKNVEEASKDNFKNIETEIDLMAQKILEIDQLVKELER